MEKKYIDKVFFTTSLLSDENYAKKAYKKYVEKKEEVIRQIAEQYKGIIPQELYSALLRYKVDIKNDRNYKM